MKKTILSAYAVLIIAAALPWLFLDEAEAGVTESPEPAGLMQPVVLPEKIPEEEGTVPPEAAVTPEPIPQPTPEPARSYEPVEINVLCGGEIITMDMQDYIVGVTAAEMPANFELEALKAQTVAARTYAMYCADMHKHGEAHVCADPNCCQAWSSDETLRTNWGGGYEENMKKLRSAADATAGQVLTYEGEAVFAAFHSSSAGATEDSGQVWNGLPYLLSVSSPETGSDVPEYVTEVRCAVIDFRDTVLSRYPEADFSGDESGWIEDIERDDSGRVKSVRLGGADVRGTEMRSLFSLRSAAFTLEYIDGQFVFTVTGFGHGVGMSQYGANVMAQNGADYTEILAHYYPGTELING